LAGILLFLSTGWAQAQEDVSRYLDPIEKKYTGLKDYTADVNVHFDIEALKAPDMQAKLYFKAPDKMKVESKRIFFLPKEGGYFNPSLFKKKDFDMKFLERLVYDGRKAVRLKLTPTETDTYHKGFVLTIDTERHLIREIKISPSEGREVNAMIEYGMFADFELPTRILLKLEMPTDEPSGMREFTQFGHKPKKITGNVKITYSNYRVNVGLSDELFKDTDPFRPK
jgi:outer membrane lipoprotein-sorting protein